MVTLAYPANVSALIFRGFLTVTVNIGDEKIVLKTVNENETADIETLSGVTDEELKAAEGEEKEVLAFKRIPWLLAYSTAQINDHNVLADRSKSGWYRPLVDFYKTRHRAVLRALMPIVARLAGWYAYEVANVERFCTEPLTRNMWFSYSGVRLNDPGVTCLEGTQYLGLNQHQILFKSFLSQWERRKSFEQQWEQTKAIIGAQNGKMMQAIERSDRARRQTEEANEQEILAGRTIGRSRSALYSEMEDELVRQIKGEKDEFDQTILQQELHEKWDMLLDRMDATMYALMYGRKLHRGDMVVVGRRPSPREQLPLGEFDMDEAKAILRRLIGDLNVAGKFLASMPELTEDEEEAVIGQTAQTATSWYKELEQQGRVKDGRVDSIDTR